jgi:putative two-component system protein, hydrogenase maturation factor HypX/HoxX
MDAGAIYSTRNFIVPQEYRKTTLYNTKISAHGTEALINSTYKFFSGSFVPEPLNYSDPAVKGRLEPAMKKKDRLIEWENDTTSVILRKILASDGAPGATAMIENEVYHLFGGKEVKINDIDFIYPGSIIGYSNHSVILKTQDGAISVSHLK